MSWGGILEGAEEGSQALEDERQETNYRGKTGAPNLTHKKSPGITHAETPVHMPGDHLQQQQPVQQ